MTQILSSFQLKMDSFRNSPKKSQDIEATFAIKIVCRNFQKLTNLVTRLQGTTLEKISQLNTIRESGADPIKILFEAQFYAGFKLSGWLV